MACEAEVFDRLIGSVQLPFSSIRYWPRDSFFLCLVAVSLLSLPKKIAVWMAIDWAGAGAGLAVSPLFFFFRTAHLFHRYSQQHMPSRNHLPGDDCPSG